MDLAAVDRSLMNSQTASRGKFGKIVKNCEALGS